MFETDIVGFVGHGPHIAVPFGNGRVENMQRLPRNTLKKLRPGSSVGLRGELLYQYAMERGNVSLEFPASRISHMNITSPHSHGS